MTSRGYIYVSRPIGMPGRMLFHTGSELNCLTQPRRGISGPTWHCPSRPRPPEIPSALECEAEGLRNACPCQQHSIAIFFRNISYHIVLYSIVLYCIVLYCVIYHTASYRVIYCIILRLIISYHIISKQILSCHLTSHLAALHALPGRPTPRWHSSSSAASEPGSGPPPPCSPAAHRHWC